LVGGVSRRFLETTRHPAFCEVSKFVVKSPLTAFKEFDTRSQAVNLTSGRHRPSADSNNASSQHA
jgi:hypothetical protein